MMLTLDEEAVRARLRPLTEVSRFTRAVERLADDRTLLSIFLMGVSLGEGLGEAGVAAIGEDEIAARMHDLQRQKLEEHGHMEGTRLIVHELFPEHFDGDRYRWAERLIGTEYYFAVREANRTRLRAADRYSRLNLYLTTSFGYEIMVGLLYGAVLEALARSSLPRVLTDRVAFVLTVILRQEETHLGIVEQHNALLATDRGALSASAVATLDRLALLTAEDYEWVAELAVREIVRTTAIYGEPERLRAHLTGAGA
jgi:hypothetical protein